MNLREAAHQALDLLQEIHVGNMTPMAENNWDQAINALRAVLAEDAMQRLTDVQQMIERGTKAWADVPDATAWVDELRGNEPVSDCHEKEGGKLSPPFRAALAEATRQESRQVEPVAWLHEWDGTALANTVPPNYYGDHWKHTPLYTAPPKRKPLTDEDIDALRQGEQRLNFVTLREFRVIARAIERAHGIGGEE